jgi:hypothetical protein
LVTAPAVLPSAKARQQQLLAIGRQQAEAEAAVVFAEADEARALAAFSWRRWRPAPGCERTQAHRSRSSPRNGVAMRGPFRAGQQDVFQVRRAPINW